MNFSMLMKRAGQFTTNNSPTILTVVGVIGTITTAYLSAKASWQASDVVRIKEGYDYRSEEDRRDARQVLKERFELTWKLYIPAATVGCATLACIIGANRVGVRRLAATAAAGTILEKTFDEYKAKVKEKLGERKEDALHAEIAQDRVNANPPTEQYLENVKLMGAPDRKLCLDLYGNQYFSGSVEKIHRAINDFNHMLNTDGFGSLADLYRMLDMDTVPTWSERIGWNQDRLVEIRVDTTLVHESEPCITMSFRNEPHQDYGRFLGRY